MLPKAEVGGIFFLFHARLESDKNPSTRIEDLKNNPAKIQVRENLPLEGFLGILRVGRLTK